MFAKTLREQPTEQQHHSTGEPCPPMLSQGLKRLLNNEEHWGMKARDARSARVEAVTRNSQLGHHGRVLSQIREKVSSPCQCSMLDSGSLCCGKWGHARDDDDDNEVFSNFSTYG
ncbi:hypothetical protein E2C01_022395 [Portunus trituberculatus]|uniref:Uncharacterized protein n=1 Tax=Portunus trituberculatus TaxID=210409 RepID=A0A5B7E760_PORTR|nr:hypothetical protein [Portunus trituberculatus]